ncbi:uncharacterized protein LOC106090428 [Stomoxys calcitrans]|uniref:uncharacterized protein LOC106090428 n=1 Tax=Stomoxys calcitrans TaxID=35570 RepID=UPI0027E3AB96|nr:uncharacterized protein LOC106090428 [Stomoxys calcitrans]
MSNNPGATTTTMEGAQKLTDEEKYRLMDNNFSTPLTGTFLNLPNEPAQIVCPSCGKKDESTVHVEDQQWAAKINSFTEALFFCLCCCWCVDWKKPLNKTDTNHYCQHCTCYLGRANRIPPVSHHNGKSLTNQYNQ